MNLEEFDIEITDDMQEIVKEYFEKQKDSKLMLCIYEEKASDDIEWFYCANTNNWCYFKPKKYKEKIGDGDYWHGTELILVEKRIKTFGKKCHVTEMSFDNFMAIDYLNFEHPSKLDVSELRNYSNKFMKLKKEKSTDESSFDLNDYHNFLIQEKENQKKSIICCFLWFLTIILLFTPIRYIAIITCPLVHILWNKKLKSMFKKFFKK